jgi:hypothetical protein
MRQVTVLKDTTSIVFAKPEVWPNPSPSLNDVQNMINSALERQAKSTYELMCMLIEEQDGKKLDTTSANHSSFTCAVNFAQTNLHTSGPLAGGTSMPNLSVQPMNHFHSRTTIEGSTLNLGMPQQTTASMYGQGYMHTAPSFTIPNPSSTPYTSGFNGQAYPNPSNNFQASYTTVAYTDPILLPGSSLGFLPNHAYQTPPRFNAYGQPKTGGFGYETLPQFPFRPHSVDVTSSRATTEPSVDPNNLTNQLATILRESFGIEPKDRRHVYQKPYPDYYDQLPYPRGYKVPEFSKFSGDDGKTILEHVGQFLTCWGKNSAFAPILRLKNEAGFTWGADQQRAFENIKRYLSSSPVMKAPTVGTPFWLYIAAEDIMIGAILTQVTEGKEHIITYLS